MQLSRISLQAVMTLSALKTMCCSGSAELVALALCLEVVDLYVYFFWSQSAASSLCAGGNGEILQCFRSGEGQCATPGRIFVLFKNITT